MCVWGEESKAGGTLSVCGNIVRAWDALCVGMLSVFWNAVGGTDSPWRGCVSVKCRLPEGKLYVCRNAVCLWECCLCVWGEGECWLSVGRLSACGNAVCLWKCCLSVGMLPVFGGEGECWLSVLRLSACGNAVCLWKCCLPVVSYMATKNIQAIMIQLRKGWWQGSSCLDNWVSQRWLGQ